MRNTLTDLNNHLFAQLERLSDEAIKGDELKEEIGRAKAVTDVAAKIVSNASLVLEAHDRLSPVDKPSGKLARIFLPEL